MTGVRWTNGVLAVWIIFSAFLGFSVVGNAINAAAVGSIVIGAGMALKQDSEWQAWTAGVAGAWLMVALLFPPLQSGVGALWNNVIVGVAILVASVPLRRLGRSPTTAGAATEAAARGDDSPAPRKRWVDAVTMDGRKLVHH